MGSNAVRRISNVVFWVFLGVGVAALAFGWAAVHASLDEARQRYLHELHISLGLVGGIVILAQLLIAIALFAFGASAGPRGWHGGASFALRQLAYLSFLALVVTGAGAAVSRGEKIFLFQFPLPSLDGADQAISGALGSAHPVAAYVLTGAIVVNVMATAISSFFPKREPSLPARSPLPSSVQSIIVGDLVQSFRFLGRIASWVQAIIALLSVPLLAFSFVGRSINPNHTILGDTIYWATGGLALLLPSIAFGASFAKVAAKIGATQERYLGQPTYKPFWFLGPSWFISIVGALISFTGVGLSVALLIGKTVSQPPGIAVTDPNRIVRALDVFVLLVNFNVLFAHFVGVAVTAWLRVSALKAHHQYGLSTESVARGIPPTITSV